MFAPVKAREHDARQADEAATGDTGTQYVSHHSAGLVQPQHAQGRGNAAKVHHDQEKLESQLRVDNAKEEIGDHAGGRDGHKQVQDAFTREPILISNRGGVKGKRCAEHRPEPESCVENPERIVPRRLLSRVLPLDVHVRVIVWLGLRTAIHA